MDILVTGKKMKDVKLLRKETMVLVADWYKSGMLPTNKDSLLWTVADLMLAGF